jgi:hypothetical protein
MVPQDGGRAQSHRRTVIESRSLGKSLGVRLMPGVAAACAFALVASGCGSIDRREVAAADTARQLLTAVQNDDGAGACAVLAPQTAARLEQDSGTSCPEAILKVGLPQTTAVTGSTVYGQWA